MAVNKVVFGAVSIMDISDSTVTKETLAKGATAYDKRGDKITGEFTLETEITEQDTLIEQIKTTLAGKAAGEDLTEVIDDQEDLILQIQTALQGKAVSGGEDVTDETTAYTTKLASLETAVAALETELAGKASGGSGGVETVTISVKNLSPTGIGGCLYYVDSTGVSRISNTIENIITAKNSFILAEVGGDGLSTNLPQVVTIFGEYYLVQAITDGTIRL